MGLFKRSECVVRDEGAVAFIFGSADVENFIGKGRFGSVENLQDSVGDFRPMPSPLNTVIVFMIYLSFLGI